MPWIISKLVAQILAWRHLWTVSPAELTSRCLRAAAPPDLTPLLFLPSRVNEAQRRRNRVDLTAQYTPGCSWNPAACSGWRRPASHRRLFQLFSVQRWDAEEPAAILKSLQLAGVSQSIEFVNVQRCRLTELELEPLYYLAPPLREVTSLPSLCYLLVKLFHHS